MTDTPAILQRRFALAEHTCATYFATLEAHIKPEDVFKPDFWRHVASTLRPYDEIVVATDACDWRMEILVCDVWHNGARVIELSRHNMKAENEPDNDIANDLRVKWRGPVDKWCVVRASDSVVLKAGLVDKNIALENLAAIAMERARIGN